MFWGLIMEPKRRYMQKVNQSFHISMAALDMFACSDEPSQVLINYGQRNYLLCTLQKDRIMQCPLDLNFEEGDVIALATNGSSNVHLTGYVMDTTDTFEESESEEEQDIEEKPEKETKRKKKISEVAVSQPPKKKTKTEQLLDEEYDSNDDESFSLSKYLNEEVEEESDENVDEMEDGDEETEDEEEEDEESNEEVSSMSDEEEQQVEVKINGKEKKKKKADVQNSFKASSIGSKTKGEQTPNKQDKSPNKQDKTPKSEKKENKTPKQDKTPKENKTPKQKLENAQKSPNQQPQTPLQKRTIEGGVIVQDLKVGDGQLAKPGKLVQVYYEGRLKQNNKVFDKVLQGAGFKFRLGKREVIKGWDVGVAGMKIGGKRRIICPPNMAYGERGSLPQIPPNSTLIFEVELKGIK